MLHGRNISSRGKKKKLILGDFPHWIISNEKQMHQELKPRVQQD